ncbi:uncharacterized protein KY384_008053 [Bacidia gigantensis]|uniref:uncharacterized protein n=1 Tax=Bacidia gigantensis TaxID=2732470 RepID=UPI001D04CF3F|nr:uncharacterized protein KY384_008053 [Bacidia gigantensis]KAG8527309.1 hypothetical protein KY384_008053 [Bacidia gigantensis]
MVHKRLRSRVSTVSDSEEDETDARSSSPSTSSSDESVDSIQGRPRHSGPTKETQHIRNRKTLETSGKMPGTYNSPEGLRVDFGNGEIGKRLARNAAIERERQMQAAAQLHHARQGEQFRAPKARLESRSLGARLYPTFNIRLNIDEQLHIPVLEALNLSSPAASRPMTLKTLKTRRRKVLSAFDDLNTHLTYTLPCAFKNYARPAPAPAPSQIQTSIINAHLTTTITTALTRTSNAQNALARLSSHYATLTAAYTSLADMAAQNIAPRDPTWLQWTSEGFNKYVRRKVPTPWAYQKLWGEAVAKHEESLDWADRTQRAVENCVAEERAVERMAEELGFWYTELVELEVVARMPAALDIAELDGCLNDSSRRGCKKLKGDEGGGRGTRDDLVSRVWMKMEGIFGNPEHREGMMGGKEDGGEGVRDFLKGWYHDHVVPRSGMHEAAAEKAWRELDCVCVGGEGVMVGAGE